MKLKYYLRGMGIGVILTAIVMGFALGGRKTTISDAEVIERARALGMVDGKGVLDPGTDSSEVSLDDSLTSDSALSQEGAEISQEVNQEFTSSASTVSDLAYEEEETEIENTESADAAKQTSQDSQAGASIENKQESVKEKEDKEDKKDNEDTIVAEEVAAGNRSDSNETTSDNASDSTSQQTTTVQAIGKKTTTPHTVTIPNGLGSEGVARILYNAGVIDDAITFNNYLVERKMDRGIRAGVKNFPAGSSYEDIARIICQG